MLCSPRDVPAGNAPVSAGMPFSSASLLQFDELKELLAKYAGSVAGRALVFALTPHNDRFALETDLAEAGEAIGYRKKFRVRKRRREEPPSGCVSIRCETWTSPSGRCVLKALLWRAAKCRPVSDAFARRRISRAADRCGSALSAFSSSLGEYGRPARNCTAVPAGVPADASLADEASVALRRIRRDIDRQQKEIQNSLGRFMRGTGMTGRFRKISSPFGKTVM